MITNDLWRSMELAIDRGGRIEGIIKVLCSNVLATRLTDLPLVKEHGVGDFGVHVIDGEVEGGVV